MVASSTTSFSFLLFLLGKKTRVNRAAARTKRLVELVGVAPFIFYFFLGQSPAAHLSRVAPARFVAEITLSGFSGSFGMWVIGPSSDGDEAVTMQTLVRALSSAFEASKYRHVLRLRSVETRQGVKARPHTDSHAHANRQKKQREGSGLRVARVCCLENESRLVFIVGRQHLQRVVRASRACGSEARRKTRRWRGGGDNGAC